MVNENVFSSFSSATAIVVLILSLTISLIFLILNIRALISLGKLHSDLRRIADELQFLNRRTDMINANNTQRNVPQDIKTDFFNKEN